MMLREAAELVALAAAGSPHLQDKELTPTARLWHQMLADLPYELAQAALLKVLATSPYFPTVAALREAAADLSVSDLPTAAEAWEETLQQIRRVGSWGRPRFSHPAIQRTVDATGWLALCRMSIDDIPAHRAQFLKLYDTFSKREREAKLLPPAVRELADEAAPKLLPGQ